MSSTPRTPGPSRAWLPLGLLALAAVPVLVALPRDHESMVAWFHRATPAAYWVVLVQVVWILSDAMDAGQVVWDPRRLARALAWPLVLTVCLFSGLGTGYRVQADEAKLQGTSLALYQLGRPSTVEQCAFWQDRFVVIHEDPVPVKPCLFPFVLNLLHRLHGYDPRHGFVLNFVVSVLLLAISASLANRLCGKPAGLVAALLVAAMPLFGLQVTSSHYDAFNLLLVMFVCWLAEMFTRAPSGLLAEGLVLGAVLACHVRAESGLLVLPVVMILFRHRSVLAGSPPHPRIAAIPLLLVPFLWQRSLASVVDPDIRPAGAAFGLESLQQNIVHAVEFFLNLGEGIYPASPVIAILAILGLGGAIVHVCRARPAPGLVDFALFSALAMGSIAAAQFSFYAGDLRLPINARYGVTHVAWMAILAAIPVTVALGHRALRGPMAGVLVLLLLSGLKRGAANELGLRLDWYRELKANLRFLETYRRSEVMIVTGAPLLYVGAGYSALAPSSTGDDPLADVVETHRFPHVLLIQELPSSSGGAPVPPIPARYRTEVVHEYAVSPVRSLRISRITGVIPTAPAAGPAPPFAPLR